MPLFIDAEQPGDATAIDAVLQACFPSPLEAQLVRLLRDAGRLTLSLVAEIDGQIAGHIAFSPVTTADGRVGLGLAPLAVLSEYRRQGIGTELVQSGLRQCRLLQHGWCVVLGDPGYYSRFGFYPASSVGLSDQYNGGDAFQIVELSPGNSPINGGLVKYAPEFAIFV